MSKKNKDTELFNRIQDIFNEKIPFNKILGLKVESIEYNKVSITFEMRHELIGNYLRGSLHGGVISSVIDVTGGLSAFIGIQQKRQLNNLESKLDRIRVALWEVRNLNIASHIRRSSSLYPGQKILVIIGSSHKIFLDNYLKDMMGVKIVNLNQL